MLDIVKTNKLEVRIMTINQQINKDITQEEYFNNKHTIEVKDLNIKVEVHSHDLRTSKVAHIESEIRETATNFKDAFKLEPGSSEQTFKIYVFDDKADYTHLGGSKHFGSHLLGDEGGKCYPGGGDGVCATMYVYKQGGVHNLQHEFAHGLTYLATGGESLPTVLMEGIADYFEHHSNHKFNAQGSSIDKTEAANLDLDKILDLEYSDDSEANSLVYKTGHALVMYLEPVHNLFRSKAAKARTTICRLVLSFRSQFFHNRLHFCNQAKDLSTTHLFGNTTKVCNSLHLNSCTNSYFHLCCKIFSCVASIN